MSRPFLRRLIDLTRNITNPFYFVKLNCAARADLHAWSVFIQSFNGKSVYLSDNWISSYHLKLFTDASGNIDYAAYLVVGGLQILRPNLYTATK